MRDRAVRSSAATRRRRRPAAGYVASPCRSILIYKPRPEGAPIHYCPAHSSRPGPVTSGRPLPRRFLPFHHQIRTVRRATSGARGPAGRSRSAGGAAPAFLFLSFPAAPPSFPLPCSTQLMKRQLVTALRYGDRRARPQWHGERQWRCGGDAPGFATPSTLYHSSGDTSALTTLQATLELGSKEAAWDRRAICCLTYARNADAALLSHAHIISKAPHYCTTKAPHR